MIHFGISYLDLKAMERIANLIRRLTAYDIKYTIYLNTDDFVINYGNNLNIQLKYEVIRRANSDLLSKKIIDKILYDMNGGKNDN